MQKIVVGIDFSESSEVALRHALLVARRTGAEIVLVHAGCIPQHENATPPSQLSTPLAEPYRDALSSEFDEVRNRLEQLRERYDGQGATVSQTFIDAYPDEGLIDAANELKANLTVVGSHGRTGFWRFVLGSVSETVARRSETSVFVARPGPISTLGYKRILVPVDFSDYTKPALDMAAKLVADDGHIDVFHAWEAPGAAWITYEMWATQFVDRGVISADATKRGEGIIAQVPAPKGTKVEFSHVEGGASVAIHEQLEKDSYDLVVMGSHGNRGFRRWFLGSVAEATVRHSPCSVLVVQHQPVPDE